MFVIGTPASPPKPRGKSPGWEPVKSVTVKTAALLSKKTVTRPPNEPSVAV